MDEKIKNIKILSEIGTQVLCVLFLLWIFYKTVFHISEDVKMLRQEHREILFYIKGEKRKN